MKLIHRDNLHPVEQNFVHDPFEAVTKVRNALAYGPRTVDGLPALRSRLSFNHPSEVFRRIESGEWLLVDKRAYAFDWKWFEKTAQHSRAMYLMETGGYHEPRQLPVKSTRDTRECVFAKSTQLPHGSVLAGTSREGAEHFGKVSVFTPTRHVDAKGASLLGWVVGAVGNRILGSLTAAAPPGAALMPLMLMLWPRDIGDQTLYTEEELRGRTHARTRVRFQFRTDALGQEHVYGLHTSPTTGTDRVPVVEAKWSADHKSVSAEVQGITITWSPWSKHKCTPTPYPAAGDELQTILVHPIAEGTDSETYTYPANEDDWLDRIFVFPADSGVAPLYLVFAKPGVDVLEVGAGYKLQGRSAPRDDLHIDHIPSQAAVRRYLTIKYPEMTKVHINELIRLAPGIAIPSNVHIGNSETYGGRNTAAKQATDSQDLTIAIDSNFDAIKNGLLESGLTDEPIEIARKKLHLHLDNLGWAK